MCGRPSGSFSWNAEGMQALAADIKVHLVTLTVQAEAERSHLWCEGWLHSKEDNLDGIVACAGPGYEERCFAGPVPDEAGVHDQLNGTWSVDNQWITQELLTHGVRKIWNTWR